MTSYEPEVDGLADLPTVMRNAGRNGYNLLQGDATPVSRGFISQIEQRYPSVRETDVHGDEYIDVTDGENVYRLEIVHESEDTVHVTASEEAVASSEPRRASTEWGLKDTVESVLGRDEDVKRDSGSLVPPEPERNPKSYVVDRVREVTPGSS